MNTRLPLFPLHTALLPEQHLDLQIFEPRYTALVKDCVADALPFGVVLIREGEEVVRTSADIPQVFSVGVSARIVDWSLTDSGMLAVKIVGEQKFELLNTQVQADKLMHAEIRWLPLEVDDAIPSYFSGLVELRQQLCQHPGVLKLQLPEAANARQLGWQLSQLLPLPNPSKMDLLLMSEPIQRLDRLLLLVEELSEGR